MITHPPPSRPAPGAEAPRRRSLPALLLLAAVPLVAAPLAGCGPTSRYTDTYNAPGTWHAEGVNDMNIAAQAANPGDLLRGQAPGGGNLRTSATAVANLWAGKTPKPAAAASGGGGASGGAGAGGGAGGSQ